MSNKYNILSIGICGLIGSGKSESIKFFKTKNISTFDLDLEAKKLLKKNTSSYKKIKKEFGASILNRNSTINKKKLRSIAFYNKRKRTTLNKIIHPQLIQRVKEIIKKKRNSKESIVVFEGALISKNKSMGKLLDLIIYIHAPKKILINRIMKRDSVDKKTALNLINMQKEVEKNRNTADFVINNGKNLQSLKSQLRSLLDNLSY